MMVQNYLEARGAGENGGAGVFRNNRPATTLYKEGVSITSGFCSQYMVTEIRTERVCAVYLWKIGVWFG